MGILSSGNMQNNTPCPESYKGLRREIKRKAQPAEGARRSSVAEVSQRTDGELEFVLLTASSVSRESSGTQGSEFLDLPATRGQQEPLSGALRLSGSPCSPQPSQAAPPAPPWSLLVLFSSSPKGSPKSLSAPTLSPRNGGGTFIYI